MIREYSLVAFTFLVLGSILFLLGPGCAQAPTERETCLMGCEQVRDACNPTEDPAGPFSYEQCIVECEDPAARLVNFPDCLPCYIEPGECTPRLFLERCVVECGLP